MPAKHGEAAHRDATGDQVVVGVAHPRRLHLDLHLVLDGVADLDLLDRPRLIELPDESAFCLHPHVPSTRGDDHRLEPLVRCVTPTPKQPLGRVSPDRYRCLSEWVVAGQLLPGQRALDPFLHTGRQVAGPDQLTEHVGNVPEVEEVALPLDLEICIESEPAAADSVDLALGAVALVDDLLPEPDDLTLLVVDEHL